jgi:1,4-dihydroxy-6-naphthoate synthase
MLTFSYSPILIISYSLKKTAKVMKLSLGFSPCPNDTFIFDGMVHGLIDTEGLEFEVLMGDVEELNRRAFAHDLDITKLSYHAFAHLLGKYELLNAGSALGRNCGPLLIAKAPMSREQIEQAKIAIPGKYTTANFLLGLAHPDAINKVEMLFSDIEDAVLRGEVDAGLIIHENRFTYQDKGLVKLMDLGEFWEQETGLPIPLGGIVVKKDLPQALKEKIDRVMRRSVEFAFGQKKKLSDFVKENAQEMDEQVMHSHINLYVNDFTVNLGESGRSAVLQMFQRAQASDLIPNYVEKIFIH